MSFADLLDYQALVALASIIVIDVVLAGDNAVVVGMAAAGLPRAEQHRVIALGIAMATALRIGFALVTIQLLSVRNELYSNMFEITVATLLSFLSAALASTTHFCYSAVASSSVVLILPVSLPPRL